MLKIINLDIRYLYTFIVVCEEGSITRAAEKLGYVQSSISNQISIIRRHFREKSF